MIAIKDIGDMADNIQKAKTRAKPVRTRGGPEAVDVHVGSRVRQRRTMLGMSQEKLGEALGLTFQQVQKYERGANRIGASRLHHISEVLDVPISYFFEELSPTYSMKKGSVALEEAQAEYDHDPMAKRETLELVRSYYKIKDPRVRRRIFELTKQLGKSFSQN
jgi:transcriptional regulator with XRE-family HTH domain